MDDFLSDLLKKLFLLLFWNITHFFENINYEKGEIAEDSYYKKEEREELYIKLKIYSIIEKKFNYKYKIMKF